jgi:hypothetical protein
VLWLIDQLRTAWADADRLAEEITGALQYEDPGHMSDLLSRDTLAAHRDAVKARER